jgi:ATP-dependent RNA helicase
VQPTVHLCTGGTLSSADRLALSGGAQVVIGTPGRVLHLLTNKSMKTHALSLLIIDEADEMLSQGMQWL